jgi:hypothetical protein
LTETAADRVQPPDHLNLPRVLGPGLIAGAADDGPSEITTTLPRSQQVMGWLATVAMVAIVVS